MQGVDDETATGTSAAGATGRLTTGVVFGGFVVGGGLTGLGLTVGFTTGLVVTGSAGGLTLIGTCVRGGEVLRGVKAVDGLTVGLFVGSVGGGRGIVCLGGSAPGNPGSSAMVAPVMVIPVATRAAAIRRPPRTHSTAAQTAAPMALPLISRSRGRVFRCSSAFSRLSSRMARRPSSSLRCNCS